MSYGGNRSYVSKIPTGDRSPDISSQTSSRTYQSPDGTRTTITTAKRSVLLSPSSPVGDGVNGSSDDPYLQHALNEMSKFAGPNGEEEAKKKKKEDDSLSKNIRSIAELRASQNLSEKQPEQVIVRETVTTSAAASKPSWMSRGNLRDSSISEKPETSMTKPALSTARSLDSSAAGKDRLLTASGQSLVWRSLENHDHLLKRYEALPTTGTKNSGYVPRDEPWVNISEEIITGEVGEAGYKRRALKQKKIFDAGAKKGIFFEELPLFFKKWGLKSIFEKKVKSSNQRATHSEGIGALGYAVIVENRNIPENDFFVPKKMFEVRARHANFPTVSDDARPSWRSLAIKFQDHDYDSPLDLVLQTGRSSPFINMESIDEFYSAIVKSPAAFKEYLIGLPCNLETILEGMRKDIKSYTQVHYHSQMTYNFVAKDGIRRVARFRVVPADGYPDTGRLKPEEQKELWYKIEGDLDFYTELLKEEHSRYEPNQYLDKDFRKRIDESTVTYNLQIQLRDWSESDTNALYNPAIIWSHIETPWQDLAKIRLLSLLPDDVIELTRFNIGHLPEGTLGIPQPTSKSDFNSVPAIRKEIYQEISRLRSNQPPPPTKDEVEYLIHVVTGNQQNAGILHNKCDVFLSLIGTDSRTAFIHLKRTTKNDFTQGERSTFTIREKYIGELQCVKVYKEKKGKASDWFVDYILVSTTYNNTCYSLPCYRWFNDQSALHILRDGTPVLFDKESDYYMKRQRQAEITMRQDTIQWRRPDQDPAFCGLPGYIAAGNDLDLLPGDMVTEEGLKLYQDWMKHHDTMNDFIHKLRNVVKPRAKKKLVDEAFEDELMDKLPDSKTEPTLQYVIRNWRSDLEFGRQMLNGTMPLKIAKLLDIPKTFPLTDDMVGGLLEGSRTLQDEIKDGRLFLVSYPELQEFADQQLNTVNSQDVANGNISEKSEKTSTTKESKTEEKKNTANKKSEESLLTSTTKIFKPKESKGIKKYLCSPMVILYLKGGVALFPLAIRLNTNADAEPIIYTPNDNKGEYSDWLVAKMWVKVAETNMHHFAARTLGTLLLLEPVAIAVSRNLPGVHPISKLLSPYLKNLVTLNTIYRKFVICEGGALSEVLALGDKGLELMKKQVSKFRKFSGLNLPENFASRGVLDAAQLPGYYYRDDALQLWEAIRDFSIDIICIYYDGDEQVVGDEELELMLADLKQNGYSGQVDLPEKFRTIEELVQFCTTILFRCTIQNSALSRGMSDTYRFCLNAPPCMMNPPPTEKRPFGYSAEYLHTLLPPSGLHDRYMGVVNLMMQGYKQAGANLGQYPDKVFTDEKAVIAIKSFQKQLREIDNTITRRQKDLGDWNYDYLKPENIPVGFIG